MRKIVLILFAIFILSLTACSQPPVDTANAEGENVNVVTEAVIPCNQEDCTEAAVDAEICFCQNHIGICGLCEKYIAPGKEYCNQCTFDLGLPVDDPDFVPEGSRFTNRYGTSSTICVHQGCSNKIASSGDTNCCTTHSQRCGNCGCYIDEDALYCMDCIQNAVD